MRDWILIEEPVEGAGKKTIDQAETDCFRAVIVLEVSRKDTSLVTLTGMFDYVYTVTFR